MKTKLFALCLVLTLGGLILSACGQATIEPTKAVATVISTDVASDETLDMEFKAASDAVLAYIREQYGEQAPPQDLAWTTAQLDPAGLGESKGFQYSARGWVIEVSRPILPPDKVVHHVIVASQTTGFRWEGEVDAAGQVTESSFVIPMAPQASGEVLATRDEVLAYLTEHYDEQAPPPGTNWVEKSITPEGLVGQVSFQFAAGDWVVMISHAVVAPEAVVYRIVVANHSTGFRWEGELDTKQHLTEIAAPERPSTPEAMLSRIVARDAALSYIYEHYQYAPIESLAWTEENITPEGLVGSSTFLFTAPDWVVTISYPVVAPDAVIYRVVAVQKPTGFLWEGEVDT